MKRHLILITIFAISLYVWIRSVFQGIHSFPCHVDVLHWTEAADYFFAERYVDAAAKDRLPLTLFAASLWMKQGFTALDALQLNSQFAWVICQVTLFAALLRFYGIPAAIMGTLVLLWSHSYAGLVLSVTAQLPFNALVALHFALGYPLAKSSKFWAWVLLGFLVSILPLCKEQGFIFPFISAFFLLKTVKGQKQKLKRILGFSIGATPLSIVLFYWLERIIVYGKKYEELYIDLNRLHGNRGFIEKNHALLNWGSIETTINSPDSYGELFINAWIRLTNEIGSYLLAGIGLAILGCVVCYKKNRNVDLSNLLWIALHIVPAIPLFVLLLIEPYHLSFLGIPAAGLFAWAAFHILPENGILHKQLHLKNVAPFVLLITVGLCLNRGQPFFRSIPWEIGSCITERMVPVIRWTDKNIPPETAVYVTDNSVRHARMLPKNYRSSPTAAKIHSQRCNDALLLLTSPSTSGYTSIKDYLHPNQWQNIKEFRPINHERWWLYKPRCK
ncbi:MAG: hypothetical protein VX278_12375 [Myxococcota bacterium]|nr:hypothetical protein [Myxococcota bacterium]